MAKQNYEWTITAYQQHGNLWLRWDTTSPFRAQQGQIHVYNTVEFPQDPTSETKAWTWDTANTPWDSGLGWGSNWYCAWIAERPQNGPYTYVVTLITTGQSKPDSNTSE